MAYSATIGAAKRNIFKMSVVGVTIAATTKIASTEYRRFRHIQRAVITRIKARKNTGIGISKISPRPMNIVKNNFACSPIGYGLRFQQMITSQNAPREPAASPTVATATAKGDWCLEAFWFTNNSYIIISI